jgi:hypothetical protein
MICWSSAAVLMIPDDEHICPRFDGDGGSRGIMDSRSSFYSSLRFSRAVGLVFPTRISLSCMKVPTPSWLAYVAIGAVALPTLRNSTSEGSLASG